MERALENPIQTGPVLAEKTVGDIDPGKTEGKIAEPSVGIAQDNERNTTRPKRERKTVAHFNVSAPEIAKSEPVMLGKGTKLRDIPNVNFKMSKISGRDELMEGLHNLIFRRKGQAMTRKKAILDFNGYSFAEDHQVREIESRKASLWKWKLDLINKLMDVLDIPRGTGDKSTKIDLIVDFLRQPTVQSSVDLASKEAEKKDKARRKREREAALKRKRVKAKQNHPTKKMIHPSRKTRKNEADDYEGEESDTEPLINPTKVTPSKEFRKSEDLPAEKLKKDVEYFLSSKTNEQLSEITPKMVLLHLQEKYGIELQSRKPEIKLAAQKYAQQRLAA